MPVFEWEALNSKGERQKGKMELASEKDVFARLREQGLIPVKVRIVSEKRSSSLLFFDRVGLVDKLMFTRYLGTMVRSGLSLPQALSVLAQQTNKGKLKRVLSILRDEIERGKPLSESLQAFPDVFSPLYVSMVKVGEETGNLDEVLNRLAEHMEKTHELRGKIIGALLYPAIILILVSLLLPLMVLKLVPQMAEAFTELEVQIPPMTQFLLDVNKFLRSYWFIFLGLITSLLFFIITSLRSQKVKEKIDELLLRVPVLSGMIKMSNTAFTARGLSTLVGAGVPILQTLEIIAQTLPNKEYRKALLKAKEEVQKGIPLSRSLQRFSYLYPPVFLTLLSVGEQTGQTAEITLKIAEFFEKETERATQNLASILPPIVMIFVGIIVGLFVFMVLQPMFSAVGSF